MSVKPIIGIVWSGVGFIVALNKSSVVLDKSSVVVFDKSSVILLDNSSFSSLFLLRNILARPISLFFTIHVVKVCMSLQMLSIMLAFLNLLFLNAGKVTRILLTRLDRNACRCSLF